MGSAETFASRRADYDNFVQRSQWIAGGIVTVLVVGGQLITSASGSHVLAAAVLTVALLAGACAAYARVEFAWAASKLEVARQQANANAVAPLPDSVPPWPQRAQNLMVAGLLLLAADGALLIALAWEAAL
jgi:hypothetical protein